MKYNEFCKTADNGKPCPHYIKWKFAHVDCESCKMCGKSLNIKEYPNACMFFDKIKEYEKTRGGERDVVIEESFIFNINTCETEIIESIVPVDSIDKVEINEKYKEATVYFKNGRLLNNVVNYDEILKKMKGGEK